MIWLTSDWHFNHDREFIYKPRGFDSVEAMNEHIITCHNILVQPLDDVYVLGDLMLGDSEKGIECIKQMKGRLHIVRGNHDTDSRIELYKQLPNVVEIENAIVLKYRKYHFYMSHYPTLTGNLEKESLKQMTLNLYGHTHQKGSFFEDRPYMFHVGIDSSKCFPNCLDDIIVAMNNKVEECKEFLDQPKESIAVTKIKETRRLVETNWDLYSYEVSNCDKCVWQYNSCPGPNILYNAITYEEKYKCPPGLNYKRDPPDGGYYG